LRSRFLISDFMIAIRKRDKSHYGKSTAGKFPL
jgi:hypothetical protein